MAIRAALRFHATKAFATFLTTSAKAETATHVRLGKRHPLVAKAYAVKAGLILPIFVTPVAGTSGNAAVGRSRIVSQA